MKMQRRKRYLIDKGLQLRYAGIILSVTFVTALISSLTVFYSTWNIVGDKLEAIYPQGMFAAILKNVALSLIFNFLLLAVFLFIFAILASHRIAGPIYRLKIVIRDIGDGKLDSLPVYLRRTDELHDVAEELNKIGDKLKNRWRSA